ncbi:protein-tyrosine phosphatase [Gracilibacillus halotolerans]|uniref:Tyrosine-protein phosphatase n=1 Tax=Gracilibacillus halotolerans TaxID=74386 RepID=A0A841RR28_9BACI|nr:protein-tyrosine phosphatase [Gracilibacillus halotolerans]
MIDISPYLLPINRESTSNEYEAKQLIKKAKEQGVTNFIAIPRISGSFTDERYSHVDEVVESMQQGMLKISLAQTLPVNGGIHDLINRGVKKHKGHYLFLELVDSHIPHFMDQLCYELQLQDNKPVLVFPERNEGIQKDPTQLYNMVKNGVLVLVSAQSILGRKGKKTRKFTQQLLDHNLVHFISSDTNEPKKYELSKAWKQVKQMVASDQYHQLRENADKIANGSSVRTAMPSRVKKKKLLGII